MLDLLTNPWVLVPSALFAVFVLPFIIGKLVARSVRMPDYWWKVGLILATIMAAIVILIPKENGIGWPPNFGVDLKGGVILIYEVDESARTPDQGDEMDGEGDIDMPALVAALSRRINPSGTKEIVIRPYGENQVEIIIPEVDDVAIGQIKDLITSSGFLEFRIVANRTDHDYIIAAAQQLAENPATRRQRVVRDEQGNPIGLWAGVAREEVETDGIRPFKVDVLGAGDILREGRTGRWLVRDAREDAPEEARIVIPQEVQTGGELAFEKWLEEENIRDLEVLIATDDGMDITGKDLRAVSAGVDERLNPSVNFTLTNEASARFALLTGDNLPNEDTGFYRRLGIVLDDELLSAPRLLSEIRDRGRITGQFTKEEVDFLVGILRAGRLPAVLRQNPISENKIGSILGADTISKGTGAIGISLAAVLVFILVYYRFAGIVACFALLLNVVLILALMILMRAALTLPGLAGLVLTVGMSVDANVLIFERIREELARGSALRMAIRNGFARATTTIVDANVTTLITAIVLYAIGTDQVRGFAVTLILGILMSMYTAIFCSRVIFDIAERRRWISSLNMMRILGATQIDFMSRRKLAAVASVLLILVGLGAVAARGKQIFDIDFLGGTSVHLQFNQPIAPDQVRGMLNRQLKPAYDEVLQDEQMLRQLFPSLSEEQFAATLAELRAMSTIDYTLSRMDVADRPADSIYKFDSSIPEVSLLQATLRKVFTDSSGQSLLSSYTLESPLLASSPTRGAPRTSARAPARPTKAAAKPRPDHQGSARLPGDNVLAMADATPVLLAQNDATQADSAPADANAEAADTEAADTEAAEEASSTPQGQAVAPAAAGDGSELMTETTLDFGENPIDAESLRVELEQAAEELNIPTPTIELDNPEWDGASSAGFSEWNLKISTTEAETRRMLEHLQQQLADTPVWPSSSEIGGQVAGKTQNLAIAALLGSLIGIIIYIWIRFQRVMFGLAAVVALLHDVLITLGAIAISAWLAGIMGFLLIEEFKISLPVVAAFLTIIGYSLNDTIVVFDRIREVRGKSPDLTGEMINTSINQTLSRTLLTSLTTLIVVLILYAMGGQGIHGFAFALVVGVIVGTYSSIFVASPILLWMSGNRSADTA